MFVSVRKPVSCRGEIASDVYKKNLERYLADDADAFHVGCHTPPYGSGAVYRYLRYYGSNGDISVYDDRTWTFRQDILASEHSFRSACDISVPIAKRDAAFALSHHSVSGIFLLVGGRGIPAEG